MHNISLCVLYSVYLQLHSLLMHRQRHEHIKRLDSDGKIALMKGMMRG